MIRHIFLISVLCLLLGGLFAEGQAGVIYVDPELWWTCVDGISWIDVMAGTQIDSVHSYACLMYVDPSKVSLDSVARGTILDTIFGQHDTVWFGWEYDNHFPDSLYFGASIFGYGAYVNGPGQLGRIWFKGKQEGETPVTFGWAILRDPYHPSGPGMEVIILTGKIVVLGAGFRFGDANSDSTIDIGDIVYLINYLFKNGPDALPWWFVGDANCDKSTDVSDVVYLINYLFKNGPEPCYPCGS